MNDNLGMIRFGLVPLALLIGTGWFDVRRLVERKELDD